jgi:hypothetical protein
LKYPALWFAFGYLDSLGVLPSREKLGFSVMALLDLCIELRFYGGNYDRGPDDISKRLRDYRDMQQKLAARKYTQ